MDIEKFSERFCIRLTSQRRVIIQVLSESSDHPSVEEIYLRTQKINPSMGIATVYRNISLLEKCGAIQKLELGNEKKARYELNDSQCGSHDHLIDLKSGEIIEFTAFQKEIERICEKIGRNLGYNIMRHKFELYGVKISETKSETQPQVAIAATTDNLSTKQE